MSRRTARAGPALRALALALALAVAPAACAAPAPVVPIPATSASPGAIASPPPAPAASPAESAVPASPGASTPGPASASPGGAVEDPSLLAVLPAEVAGQPVVLESQAFVEAMADPAFASSIEAAAFGIVVAGNDLASAVVARRVPGELPDAWFRDWRDSYNEGACGQSGGVAGNAEADIGGRTVHIATCAGGLRTYHAWLEDRGLLVSAFAVGEQRFGELLMAGLRP